MFKSISSVSISCAAPAKLNLFLHVIGRRADGYHELQTVFQLIDLADTLDFQVRDDAVVQRINDIPGVPASQDLCVRAALALQQATQTSYGVDIHLAKKIPTGAGLGGGSSDAASTLVMLNHLWQTGLSRAELMRIGLTLGADVPFFVFGQNAFAQGIGEQLEPLALPNSWFVVIQPRQAVATATVFAAPELTRDTVPVKITDFSDVETCFSSAFRNDLQAVVLKQNPIVARAYQHVKNAINTSNSLGLFNDSSVAVKMTGSGSCLFTRHRSEKEARCLLDEVNREVNRIEHNLIESQRSIENTYVVAGLNQHPLDGIL